MKAGEDRGLAPGPHADQAPARGLTSAEAEVRLAAGGQNVLPAPRPVRLWRRVAAELRDPLVLVLLAAAVLTIATGDWTDASVIMLVIVVTTSAGVTPEVKADHAITALTRLPCRRSQRSAGTDGSVRAGHLGLYSRPNDPWRTPVHRIGLVTGRSWADRRPE